MKLDKYLITLALETLLEQVKDAENYKAMEDRIRKQIAKIKEL